MSITEHSELGKKSKYESTYNPDRLFPIPRQTNRASLEINSHSLPFHGFDYWNHYEVSWLNHKGKPVAALAEIIYGCDSEFIIESKSMKLYFNSFNNTQFTDISTVEATIRRDLSKHIKSAIFEIKITPIDEISEIKLFPHLEGVNLDILDIDCSVYHNQPLFLKTEEIVVEETLSTNLLKSNCLVTNQPDWGSLQISYKGKKINHEGLLRYIVSFRNENEFHEHCVEKIFMQIQQYCQPDRLTVYGRFTRRGGLDINAIRGTEPIDLAHFSPVRLYRQ